MYGEISFIISLGLILIIILTHFNFKNKLFNFENNLKNNKKNFKNKIDIMQNKVHGNYKKFIGPIDCKGKWKCNDKCIKTFIVDTYPKYGGNSCPTGSYSIKNDICIPGTDCPINQDCIWDWSSCGSNCDRNINIIKPSSGNGIACPKNKGEAQLIKNIPPCLDDVGRGQQDCIPSDCEGYWGSCGSNCKQMWIKTKDAVPISKECPNLGSSRICTGDNCENIDCEWQWSPCIGNRRMDVMNENTGQYSKIIINQYPKGNGSSCPVDYNSLIEPIC